MGKSRHRNGAKNSIVLDDAEIAELTDRPPPVNLEQTYKSRTRPQDKPRHHAARIMLLDTKDERRAALELVPEDIRHIVRFYIMDAWARRNGQPLPTL